MDSLSGQLAQTQVNAHLISCLNDYWYAQLQFWLEASCMQKMDPQLYKLLETSYEAWTDSGIDVRALRDSNRVGVYTGTCGSEVGFGFQEILDRCCNILSASYEHGVVMFFDGSDSVYMSFVSRSTDGMCAILIRSLDTSRQVSLHPEDCEYMSSMYG